MNEMILILVDYDEEDDCYAFPKLSSISPLPSSTAGGVNTIFTFSPNQSLLMNETSFNSLTISINGNQWTILHRNFSTGQVIAESLAGGFSQGRNVLQTPFAYLFVEYLDFHVIVSSEEVCIDNPFTGGIWCIDCIIKHSLCHIV